VNSIWAAAATRQCKGNETGRSVKVREGVKGDHLVVDGDIGIEHPVSPRRHRRSVNCAWAAAVNFDYKVKKTSSALPYQRAAAR
jgi:hypothetical protein